MHWNSLRCLFWMISPAWPVWDHGQDFIQPAAHNPAAVPSHGISAVCREGGSGTVPAAGGNCFALCQRFLNRSPNCCVVTVFGSFVHVCFCQDANECWLQMVRVLQQKLEPLESDTPMEVRISNTVSTSSQVTRQPLVLFVIYRLSLKAVLPLLLPRRTSSTSILVSSLKLRILVMSDRQIFS